MAFQLPNLTYDFNALTPYIDEKTMKLHHGKHHQGYVTQLNKAISGTVLAEVSIESILQNVSRHGDAVRNHGGGHYNHSLFWTILTPQHTERPSGALADAIWKRFGSFDQFQEAFTDAAATRFGSGWAWLYVNSQGQLDICSTPNQDNPLMDVVPEAHRGTPILGLDVWEHAYYLHYQNRRADYIAAFWQIVNWHEVIKRWENAHS